MQNIVIVIQARMGSTRLPGKVLLDFCGKPLMKFQIDLLHKYNLVKDIIVATSINNANNELVDYCKKNNINVFRGSEEDVFSRYYLIAQNSKYDHIIRLTGDNPLPNYLILKKAIKYHVNGDYDLTTTRTINKNSEVISFVPKGQSVDIIKKDTLVSINYSLLSDFEKEHVIPFFYKHNKFKIKYIKYEKNKGQSFSIDTEEDYKRISKLIEEKLANNKIEDIVGYKVI